MAPDFYHYSPLWDMEAQHMEKGKPLCSRDRVWVLQLVLQVLTFIAVIVVMVVLVSSSACYKHERLNTTGVLEQTQRELADNHTVATLTDSLEKQEKDHLQMMQKKEEEHQREIQILNQKLQEMSKKLKSSGKLCEDKVTSASSGNTLHRYVLTFLLLLWALIFF